MDLILKHKELWLLLDLYIIFVEINLIRTDPQPENSPLDVGLGVITAVGSAFETLQNGMIVTREHDFNTSLLSVHSKSSAGMGNAVVKRKESSEEVDEYWRKKRAIVAPDHKDLLTKHEIKHRKKRSPCYYGRPPYSGNPPSGGNPTPTEPTDAEEARRRIVRMLGQRRRNVLQRRSSKKRTKGRR